MPSIKDYRGNDVALSEQRYRVKDTYDGGHTDLKGKVVRLIAGVDGSSVPGYHFMKGWTTVCPDERADRYDEDVALFMGVPKNALVKID